MLGDMNTGVRWAAAPIAAFCSALKPVVPMTSATPRVGAGLQVVQRAFGAREVDQHLAGGEHGVEVVGDGDAGGAAEEGAGVLAQQRAAGDVERAGERAVGGVEHRLDQHAAHAPGGAGDGDAQRRRRRSARRGHGAADSSGG